MVNGKRGRESIPTALENILETLVKNVTFFYRINHNLRVTLHLDISKFHSSAYRRDFDQFLRISQFRVVGIIV